VETWDLLNHANQKIIKAHRLANKPHESTQNIHSITCLLIMMLCGSLDLVGPFWSSSSLDSKVCKALVIKLAEYRIHL